MAAAMVSPWFNQLQDEEDPALLQDFIGDWLVDFPLQDMGALMDNQEFHHSNSSGSECNSSTATPPDIISPISNKRPKLNDDNVNNIDDSNAQSTKNNSMQKGTTTSTKKPKRLPDQCLNHIIAERQRRQTLSQLFIALSALVPGLKKMDKTSVLGEAINHMKHLKERLKVLEEETAKRAVESVVVVKRSQVMAEDESNSSSNNLPPTPNEDQLPHIEVRFSNRSVLLKIHCEKRRGILIKIIGEIEELHLSVSSTNAMTFNDRTLDITIVAQMEPEFNMTPQNVIRNLRGSCQ